MNTRKKVLLCITKAAAGGAQKYIRDIATHLPSDQFETVVVAGAWGPLFDVLHTQGIRTISVPGLGRDISPIHELQAFFNLIKIFIKERPDIIHLNSSKMGSMGAVAAWCAKLLTCNGKPRIIFTVHGWGFREDRSIAQRGAIFAVSWISSLFHNHVIVINSADHRDACAFIPRKKITMIPLGLEEIAFMDRQDAQHFFSEQYGIPTNKFLIGVTAELTKNKGISYLLDALHLFKNSQSSVPIEIHAVIMGAGEDRQSLGNQTQELGLTNDSSIVGFVPEAGKYLKAFDAFLLPSVKEGLPYALMEAMAAGLPVIASRVGGIPDLITHNKNGKLVTPKNPDALKENIANLLASPEDRRAFGVQATQTIATHYSLQQMITKTAQLYHELTPSHQ